MNAIHLHLHIADRKVQVQKDCLRLIGSLPDAVFTTGKYLSQPPNALALEKRTMDSEILCLIFENEITKSDNERLLDVIRKRREEGRKTLVITFENIASSEDAMPALEKRIDCFSENDCKQALTLYLR